MCSGCLHARLAELPEPMGKREVKRARRMYKCGKSLLHIGRVLGVSEPTVQATLRAA
jgi:transposase-like protein